MFRSLLSCSVAVILAMQVPGGPQKVQPRVDNNQKSPMIRSTTRVVNVNVRVTDREGQPVQGLNKDDFQILESGKPQQIAFFSTRNDTDAASAVLRPLGAGEHTNDPRRSGTADHGGTIILFDTVHTAYLSQAYGLGKIRIFLRQLQPQDRVGIYVLNEKGLKVIYDLGQPASALLEAIQRYDEAHSRGKASNSKKEESSENSTGLLELDRFLQGKEDRRPLSRCDPERFRVSIAAFQEIARRTLGLAGRKAVIWVTEKVSFPLGEKNAFDYARGEFCGLDYNPDLILEESADLPPLLGSRSPRSVESSNSRSVMSDRIEGTLSAARDRNLSENDEMDLLLRLLNGNDIAIYPVSAEGLQAFRLFGPGDANPNAPLKSEAMDATAPLDPHPGAMPAKVLDVVDAVGKVREHQQMEELAHLTGGRAYYDRNDLETGIRRALDDAQNGYELAYYPDHDRWNGDWRKIEVKVDRPGVTVLARGGYYAFPEPRLLPPKASKQLLEEIAASPLEDTEIPITVKLPPPGGVPSGTVEARVYVNPETMFSDQLGHGWKSDYEVLFFQLTAKNKTLDVTTETVGLELTDAKYTKALKEGFDTVGAIQLKPGAALLYVIVHDKRTDAVGSVRIPLDQYAAAHPN